MLATAGRLPDWCYIHAADTCAIAMVWLVAGLDAHPLSRGSQPDISLLVICRLRRVLPNCSTRLRRNIPKHLALHQPTLALHLATLSCEGCRLLFQTQKVHWPQYFRHQLQA